MYKGLLIKESLSDETILDLVEITNVELWATEHTPKYWTAISFVSHCMQFPERLSNALREDARMKWYVDFSTEQTKYIVLKNLVLQYEIGNRAEKEGVIKTCMERGVPVEQLDWSE